MYVDFGYVLLSNTIGLTKIHENSLTDEQMSIGAYP